MIALVYESSQPGLSIRISNSCSYHAHYRIENMAARDVLSFRVLLPFHEKSATTADSARYGILQFGIERMIARELVMAFDLRLTESLGRFVPS